MPAVDSAALIVARFLRSNNYTESYEAFLLEAGLPQDAGDASPNDLTLERLLEEKRLFDQSVNFEKLNLNATTNIGWSSHAPSNAVVVDALPGRVNLLNVLIGRTSQDGTSIVASTSDRRINIVALPELTLRASWTGTQDSPVLCQILIRARYHVSASMSGNLVVTDIESGAVLIKRKDHEKFIVSLAIHEQGEHILLVSAGWDNRVIIYDVDLTGVHLELGAPRVILTLPTKPEAIAFTEHSISKEPILIVTRADSSELHFWSKDGVKLGSQNLAPHSNAWVAFTPASIAICPTDKSLLAVATNSTPHMKLIVVKLFVVEESDTSVATEPTDARQQARTQQAIADREHDAIKLHCNTMSGQTPYSTPLAVWRPDGKGVWVNSDDGLIRGIDVLSGKIVSELRGHEAGSKVRTLWSGYVDGSEAAEERLVSGGFDHKLIIWKP